MKGETSAEIAAMARAMRDGPPHHPPVRDTVPGYLRDRG